MTNIIFGDRAVINGSAHNEGILVINSAHNNTISVADVKIELSIIRDYINDKKINYISIEDIDSAVKNLDNKNFDKFKKNMYKIKDKLIRISEEIGIQIISQYLTGALLK